MFDIIPLIPKNFILKRVFKNCSILIFGEVKIKNQKCGKVNFKKT